MSRDPPTSRAVERPTTRESAPSQPAPPPVPTQSQSQTQATTSPTSDEQTIATLKSNLEAARARDDAPAIAGAAYALGLELARVGNAEAARVVLLDAEAEAIRSKQNVADVLLLAAQLAEEREDAPAALVYVDRVSSDPASQPTEAQRAQARLIRGEVAAGLGQWDVARRELSAAAMMLPSDGGPAVAAAALAGLSARLAASVGEATRAAPRFDEQADLLRQAGRYREMARALARAGAAYAQADLPDAAADRYYRAARSIKAARGDDAEAARLLATAQSIAERNHDAARLSLIHALQQRLPPATQPTTLPATLPATTTTTTPP